MNPGDCLGRLWEIVEGRLGGPGSLSYIGALCGQESGYDPGNATGGSKHPNIQLKRVGLIREPQWKPDLDQSPLEDACELAHEYGHFLSEERGERSPEYEAALDVCYAHGRSQERPPTEQERPPTQEERDLICDEEERAWDYGRETLADLGVTDWARFDAVMEEKLAGYRCFATAPLLVPPAWRGT